MSAPASLQELTLSDVTKKFEERCLSPDSFCAIPFTTLILDPDGQVCVCHQKGTEHIMGSLQDSSLEEIWNNDLIRTWRRDLLEGAGRSCAQEISHCHCNLCPGENLVLDQIEQFAEVMPWPPKRLVANLNGLCNLECQMCHVWKMPNGAYDKLGFWQWGPAKLFKGLAEIELMGGEPFIQKDTYRLIDEISTINPNCSWLFATNLNWKLTKDIKNSLDKINIRNMVLSIDSLWPDTYRMIRKRGSLEFVLNNLGHLLVYQQERINRGGSSLGLRLNFLVQKDNWQEVEDVIDFCEEKGVAPFVTYLYEPPWFSLSDHKESECKRILNYYLQNLSWDKLSKILRVINPLLECLNKFDRANFLVELYKIKR